MLQLKDANKSMTLPYSIITGLKKNGLTIKNQLQIGHLLKAAIEPKK